MNRFLFWLVKFGMAMFACIILCVFIWANYVDGTFYRCTDPTGFDFLDAGDWYHASGGDTLKAGWNPTKLWGLWFSFIASAILISGTIATLISREPENSHRPS
jgi:hypothetical protein